MEVRDLSTVAIKLGGLWLIVDSLVQMVAYLPFLFGEAVEQVSAKLTASVLFSGIFPIVIGLALLAYGGLITKAFFPNNPMKFEWNSFESRLLAVLGVWLVVSAIADSAALGVHLYSAYAQARELNDGFASSFSSHEQKGQLVGIAVRGAFGIWLMLGGQGIVNAFNVIRRSSNK
jgi:energy-coupling factor transporter transmembrane protein EcfT